MQPPQLLREVTLVEAYEEAAELLRQELRAHGKDALDGEVICALLRSDAAMLGRSKLTGEFVLATYNRDGPHRQYWYVIRAAFPCTFGPLNARMAARTEAQFASSTAIASRISSDVSQN
jgi:hypothetical protein